MERTSDPVKVKVFERCFPEAPGACSKETWEEYSQLLVGGSELWYCDGDMTEKALKIYASCKLCRMWSGRQVTLNQIGRASCRERVCQYV